MRSATMRWISFEIWWLMSIPVDTSSLNCSKFVGKGPTSSSGMDARKCNVVELSPVLCMGLFFFLKMGLRQ